MAVHEQYMHRCLQLAGMGAGFVAPNPMVGAVLVHDGRIIGEGYHIQYGQAHAEVNCINSVAAHDMHLIEKSVLYVSLEPCAHFGKTPPCADLIIARGIPHVVVGCRDPFKQVDGKGIEKLRAAGIEVTTGVLEKECVALNKRFFCFHTKHRPYIVLKWAQTANNKIATLSAGRLLISNAVSNKLVHKWRSEEAAILIGTNTAMLDDPALTNRLWFGKSPVRLVIDMHLRLPHHLQIFDGKQPTVIFNSLQHSEDVFKVLLPAGGIRGGLYQVTEDVSMVHQVLNACYQNNIQSILVEGGARLLQSFIDEEAWDEARIITNETLTIEQGLPAPQLLNAMLVKQDRIFTDTIAFYRAKP
ncbi:bifunctional diaminohydroxyphosphoribosylaminopyrimidine deaminase/5-amino-6-(5-phosphoribosylamino)uracil reductase RibD [Panacibacter sp. DH6]|uniref:Riboflavin biosynthesis protein RibD n=1 Tax=Panacibacter microcysteis TaxID=2793269 RepID=A0A931GYJ4_9BACT|nr:bifunctional diaminohydroxyphosphoribosylaminopyrimidine deaminase/5-amino-6-(5-phosphoribosylamino)uracil reductase RibD [Panacibacter microcysteis]MBG9376317.1 bifunctional diaminohydroxyphosphoribosylaminopyrimidine deaminase/5-amino-6-(5-phosphoribosylamino)uracil reductase RibD [Panacibacter microcysteis]